MFLGANIRADSALVIGHSTSGLIRAENVVGSEIPLDQSESGIISVCRRHEVCFNQS